MLAKYWLGCGFACLSLLACQTAENNTARQNAELGVPWRLTFSDDFEGIGKPDPKKWKSERYNRRDNPKGPDGWWTPENVRLDGAGNLVLSVTQIPNRNRDDDEYDFAAGMVSTKGLFEQRFGRFEMRGKLPRETGWWAAFWLFSKGAADVGNQGRDGTEIDILEGFARSNNLKHVLHWDGASDTPQSAEKALNLPGLREGFHIFAVEWSPSEYVFFVDGVETWRTSAGGVSQVPAYIKLTAEISSQDWAITDKWAGPIHPSSFPDQFVIDYVKVWSR